MSPDPPTVLCTTSTVNCARYLHAHQSPLYTSPSPLFKLWIRPWYIKNWKLISWEDTFRTSIFILPFSYFTVFTLSRFSHLPSSFVYCVLALVLRMPLLSLSVVFLEKRFRSSIDNIPYLGLETLPIITYSHYKPGVQARVALETLQVLLSGQRYLEYIVQTRVMALHEQSIQRTNIHSILI